jgi:hypothetical protein
LVNGLTVKFDNVFIGIENGYMKITFKLIKAVGRAIAAINITPGLYG